MNYRLAPSLSTAALIALSLALGACASKGQPTATTPAATDTSGGGSVVEGANSNAAGQAGLGNGRSTGNGSGTGNNGANGSGGKTALSYDITGRTVYFDYDAAEPLDSSKAVVDNWGRYLADHPQQKVRLAGHTDERGSREYNLALGEQRAQAIASALKGAGVNESQITSNSMGEESPADPGHDEAAWAKNRRVEISQ